jgi:hypothetical protein
MVELRCPLMDDQTLEAELIARAREHHCKLIVELLRNGLTRASLKTAGHPIYPDGAIKAVGGAR